MGRGPKECCILNSCPQPRIDSTKNIAYTNEFNHNKEYAILDSFMFFLRAKDPILSEKKKKKKKKKEKKRVFYSNFFSVVEVQIESERKNSL